MNRFKVGMDIYDVKHVIIVEKDWEASKMRSEVMWQDFCRRQGLATDTPYEAFSFGGPPFFSTFLKCERYSFA